MKRIVIRVITYNQEDVISRALDSLLCQKDWGLYRVVVSDDCSKDRTWDILQEYQRKYPDVVDIYQNEHNLGIYGNVAKADTYLPDYDLFGELSGDDSYCDGYFEAVQKLIRDKAIDTSDAIGIISDWKTVYPNGNESVFKQDAVLTGHDLWSLKARRKVTARSILITKKVHMGYEPLLSGKGLNLTESHRDAQPFLNIEKAYYLPIVSSIYYSGIGVSSCLSLKESTYLTTQSIEKWNYALQHYVNNSRDKHYALYELLKAEYYTKPSLLKLFNIFFHYERGQLSGCRNSFTCVVREFYGFFKYYFSFIKQHV